VGAPYKSIYVTRYMGSKLRLLDFIVPKILAMHKSNFVFVDLMAGTHALGYALRDYASVIANDVQRYSTLIGTALISNSTVQRVESDQRAELNEEIRQLVPEGWFSKTYADTYFSREQCREVETIRSAISRHDDEPLRSILLLALMYAMGYAQSSPGHFAQYMPASHPRVQSLRALSVRAAFRQYLEDVEINVAGPSNEVHQRDVHEFLANPPGATRQSAVVAYLDPPYSTAQYSRYYHLLETVVLDDEPEVAFKGLYRPDRFSSQFCSRSHVREEFRRVIQRTAELGWELVISYGTHALLPAAELLNLAKQFYTRVEMSEQSYPHSMQGRGVVQDRSELIFVCRS